MFIIEKTHQITFCKSVRFILLKYITFSVFVQAIIKINLE